MKHIAALLTLLTLIAPAYAADTQRLKVFFDIIEADKNLKAEELVPAVYPLMKRRSADNFKYLAGGDFTLAPYTEEHFFVRQEGSELELTLAWEPVISGGTRRIALKYKAVIYYPMQKFQPLERAMDFIPGSTVVVTESDSDKGARDTRPLRVLLSANFIDPVYAFPILGGIGARIQAQSGFPYISEVIEGGPASAAKLKFGDEITEVDGYSTLQMSLDKVTKLLRGDPDTKVKLKIHKAGTGAYEEIELIRRILE